MTLLSWMMAASPVYALPLYDMATSDREIGECKTMNTAEEGYIWDEFASTLDDTVYIYLSEDFAEDYSGYAKESITQDQARAMVMASMEVWNRESRGPVFVFAGESSYSLLDAFRLNTTCSNFARYGGPDGASIEQPAVLISAWEEGGKKGGIRAAQNSSGSWCYSHGNPLIALNIQEPSVEDIRTTMIHELGHVLGLSHSWGDTNDGADGPMSVMKYYSTDFDKEVPQESLDERRGEWRMHLWPYDIDCVDDNMSGEYAYLQQDMRRRSLEQQWRIYSPADNTWSGQLPDSRLTTKTGHTAGMLEIDALDDALGGTGAYPLYHDASHGYGQGTISLEAEPYLDVGTAADGYAELDYYTYILDDEEGESVNISPLMLTAYEGSSLYDTYDWMLYYNTPPLQTDSDTPSHTDIALLDPPPMAYLGGERPGSADVSGALRACTDASACSLLTHDWEDVESHVSLRAAWDPVSERTLFASVRTRDCSSSTSNYAFSNLTTDDRCGQIRVYPGSIGFVPGMLLEAPGLLDDSVATPLTYDAASNSESYSYSATTNTAPAIACAPEPDGIADGMSNCILSWVDSGTPDGHILSISFYIDGDEVIFDSVAQVVEPYYRYDNENGERSAIRFEVAPLQSQSDLSMSYADGRFWLAYKSAEQGTEGAVGIAWSAYRNLDSWQYQETLLDEITAEAPGWIYDPREDQREQALVWSSTD